MNDEPRLLHRRSELGYTARSGQALAGEPEAVRAEEQAPVPARRRACARRSSSGGAGRSRGSAFQEELEQLRQSFGPRIAGELRGIRRELNGSTQAPLTTAPRTPMAGSSRRLCRASLTWL